jgi:hypothetical protein
LTTTARRIAKGVYIVNREASLSCGNTEYTEGFSASTATTGAKNALLQPRGIVFRVT